MGPGDGSIRAAADIVPSIRQTGNQCCEADLESNGSCGRSCFAVPL